jgi:hypothetical protein
VTSRFNAFDFGKIPSISFSTLTYPGKTPLAFNKGDTYQIWRVARLLDQNGVGKGVLLTGTGTYGTDTIGYAEGVAESSGRAVLLLEQ